MVVSDPGNHFEVIIPGLRSFSALQRLPVEPERRTGGVRVFVGPLDHDTRQIRIPLTPCSTTERWANLTCFPSFLRELEIPPVNHLWVACGTKKLSPGFISRQGYLEWAFALRGGNGIRLSIWYFLYRILVAFRNVCFGRSIVAADPFGNLKIL